MSTHKGVHQVTVLGPAQEACCSFKMVDVGCGIATNLREREDFKTIHVGVRRMSADQGHHIEKYDISHVKAVPAIHLNNLIAEGYEVTNLARRPVTFNEFKNINTALVEKIMMEGTKRPFIESEDGVQYLDQEEGAYYPLMNFTIEPMGIVTKSDYQGVNEKHIEVKICCYGKEKILTIERKCYKQLAKIVLDELPESYLEAEVKNSSKLIQKYLAMKYREKSNRLYARAEMVLCGWVKTPDNQMRYIHGGIKNMCNSTKIIPEYHSNQRREIFLAGFDFLSVGNSLDVILAPFIFGHLGFLCKLFEDARFRPTFSLFLRGESNAYKTSVAREIFNVFETDPEKKIATFKFTQTALEMALSEAKDDVFILDDMSQSLKGDETEQNLKMERILRSVGDSSPKSRADKNMKGQVKFNFRSVMCITGEDETKGSLSSQVRLVAVEVNRQSYNFKKMEYFQQHSNIMRAYFGTFIHFLELNYEQIVEYINQTFPILRQQYRKLFKIPRLIDSLTTMVITNRIILQFAFFCEAMERESAEQLFLQLEGVLIETIRRNEDASKTLEPDEMYITAINQLCANGVIQIADNIDAYKHNMGKYIGYRTENELWFKHEALFDAVCTYWSKQGTTFFNSAKKIHKMLYEKGISKGYETPKKHYYLKKSALEGRPNMLCINEEKFKFMLETINN